MSARYTPKDVHPSIFEAMHDLTSAQYSGHGDPKSAQAYSKFTSVWLAEYWTGLVAMGIGLAGVVAATAFASEYLGKPGKVMVFMTMLCVWAIMGMMAYRRNRNLLTWQELEAIRPGLVLTDQQILYIECLQYVEESKILDPNQKKSWRNVLYNALDQALVLTKLSNEMRFSSGSKNHAENLAEIARIEASGHQTIDPIAKDAYNESLRLATERLSKWNSIAVQAERTEAHLELTKQTFLKTRDTLKSMSFQNQQMVQIDLEPLRANLSRVDSEAHEIQRAIEELRQI
jgi:hypothetical protein